MVCFVKNLPKHFKSALKNLKRYLAMSISCSSAVMITLVLMGTSMVLAENINLFTKNIENHLMIHASIDSIAAPKMVKEIKKDIEKQSRVKSVKYSSKDQELDILIKENGSVFERYREHNPMSDVFIVEVKNVKDIPIVTKYLNNLKGIEKAQYGGQGIKDMIQVFELLRKGITIFVLIIGILSVFLIVNTIKLTIQMRKQEIAIMRNVGATNSYIKMPFMFEGMFIGILASIIPILLTFFGYTYLYQYMDGCFFSSMFTMVAPDHLIYRISVILLLSGIFVGILSSFLATTKYLRWRR